MGGEAVSVQVKSIVLYSHRGAKRTLTFRLGRVNIVTGQSRTGKSAIIDIIDYCTGRSTFTVFEGVNRQTVAWYAVLLRVSETDVFIAKPAPQGAAASQSRAFFKIGAELESPEVSELAANTTDSAIEELLSGLVGIGPNQTVAKEQRVVATFEATIAHAKFLLFQEQGVVANRSLLFHRQSEPFIEQAIKDTLPYFLGAVREDYLANQQRLREVRRDLARVQRTISEAEAVVAVQSERALALVAEAQNVGFVIEQDLPSDGPAALELLRRIDAWQPTSLNPEAIDARMERLNRDLAAERRSFRSVRERTREAQAFASEAQSFTNEASHQVDRLQALGVFEGGRNHDVCPLCLSVLKDQLPTVIEMRQSLATLTSGLSEVERERPRVKEVLAALAEEERQLKDRIRDLEVAVTAAEREADSGRRLGDIYARASRVAGRVSLFLESLKEVEPDTSIRRREQALLRQAEELEQTLGGDETEDVTASALNLISARMSDLAESLDLEHKGYPYRLDLKRLTVVADVPGHPIPMSRMGSAENWLGCHLITHIAIHEFMLQNKRPVPNFLVLDQPSQVYFPSQTYRALSGTVGDTMAARDVDTAAVQRMFAFLFDACERLSPDFQVIVTEHANLADTRFQAALVEEPWLDGRALIPFEWIEGTAASNPPPRRDI
jgi:hypothetical protein